MSSFNKYRPGSVGEMITVALPMVVSFACDTVMIFTDRLFLAKLSSHSMSASMAGGLSVFMLMAFFLGLIGYTTALVAQYLGADKKSGCSRSLAQAVIIALVAYPFILACIPAVHVLFAKSGIDPIQLAEQKKYFNILVFGSILSLLRHALSSFFTGIGHTRVVMMGAFVAMTVNVALNYIFVFGKFGCPALGIEGAALGTVLASACGVLVLLSVYLSPKIRSEFMVDQSWGFDRAVMGKLLYYGYPGGFEFLFNLVAFTAMVFVLHSEGVVAAAASTVALNWDMVAYIPLMGIEIGVTSLVGRYMGARQIDVVKRVVVSGLKMGFSYGVIMIVMFGLFPFQLVDVFRPQLPDGTFTEAVPIAVAMVKLVALYVTAQAVFMVFIGALRGAGDTMWAMRISVVIHWLVLGILFVMLKIVHTPVIHAWMSLVAVFMAYSITPYLRYRAGKWKTIRVVGPEMA